LPDDLLVKTDRCTMANSLEARSPFLDTALIEYAASLPDAYKLARRRTKAILRDAFADLIPADIDRRPKTGFGVPLDRWFRADLEAYTHSMLGPGARARRHVQGQALDQLLAEHRSGAAAHGHALWTLLTLEVFLRRHDW
jgi:asparagine synthase (glutamine-hydrolysing)